MCKNINLEGDFFSVETDKPIKVFRVKEDGKTFPYSYPSSLISLSEIKDKVTYTQKARQAVQALKGRVNLYSGEDILVKPIKWKMKKKPFSHQVRAVNHLCSMPKTFLLAEQGLGKTFITLMYLQGMKESGTLGKVVILAPKVSLVSWVNELKDFPDLSHILFTGENKDRYNLRRDILNKKPDIILCSFSTLSTDQSYSKDTLWKIHKSVYPNIKKSSDKVNLDKLLDKKFFDKHSTLDFLRSLGANVLIIDEASKVIHDTKVTHNALLLAKNIKFVHLLSGTLVTKGVETLYYPCKFVEPALSEYTLQQFSSKYLVQAVTKGGGRFGRKFIVGYKNLDVFKSRMRWYTLSLKREDCLDLPEREIQYTKFELTEEQRNLTDLICNSDSFIFKGKTVYCHLVILKFNLLRQVASGFITIPKTNPYELCKSCKPSVITTCIQDYILPGSSSCKVTNTKVETEVHPLVNNKEELFLLDLQSLGGKKIVWYNYRYERETLENLFKKNKITYIHVKDKDSVNKFNSENIEVFFGHISQGVGITLNTAKYTLYYNVDLMLESYLQSRDRNYRIGQDRKVLIRHYLAEDSIDEGVIKAMECKKSTSEILQNFMPCSKCKRKSSCTTTQYSSTCLLTEQLEGIVVSSISTK